MNLIIPPEPTLFKKQSEEQKSKRQWDIDTLAVWFGNRIPSYLWKESGWEKPLKEAGYNWQSFLKILSLHKKDMIRWSRDAISWKDFLLKIQDTIKDPVFKKLLIS